MLLVLRRDPQFIRENHPSVVCDSAPEFQHLNDLPSVPATQAENTYFPASFGHFGMPELHYIFGFDQKKWIFKNYSSPCFLSKLDDFSGLETDAAGPTEEDYVVYDEGRNLFFHMWFGHHHNYYFLQNSWLGRCTGVNSDFNPSQEMLH